MKQGHENCYFCRGEMLQKKITVDYWWKEELILIEDVPAWVCIQCGEEVFEGAIVEKMEKVAKEKKKIKTIQVNVKKFGDTTLSSTPVLS